MFVENILHQKGSKVLTARAEMKAMDAARELIEKNIGLLLVTAPDGKIAGIFSERDIVRGLAERDGDISEASVGDLMTKDVITCRPGDSLQKITSVMTAKRIRHLPVLNDGDVVGLISIGDVLKFRLEESLLDEEAMRDYIAGRSY